MGPNGTLGLPLRYHRCPDDDDRYDLRLSGSSRRLESRSFFNGSGLQRLSKIDAFSSRLFTDRITCLLGPFGGL